ncbi:MAG: orotidine-5'-phosphate decarboxylase, partial [Alphaproteobacteria bacterium]
MTSPKHHPVFIAVDTKDFDRAQSAALLAARLNCGIKLGLEFFIQHGPQRCAQIMEHCAQETGAKPLFFLDLKLHDIPNTVAGGISSALALQPDFITLHAAGGQKMMEAAAASILEARLETGLAKTRLVAVTVLTSMDDHQLNQTGIDRTPQEQVLALVKLAMNSGIHTIVCSPLEIEPIRQYVGDAVTLITPGIRPKDANSGDQQRVLTPKQAIRLGADYLVIGRPVTASPNP